LYHIAASDGKISGIFIRSGEASSAAEASGSWDAKAFSDEFKKLDLRFEEGEGEGEGTDKSPPDIVDDKLARLSSCCRGCRR